MGFDTTRRWQLHPRVALRPEPFGAMAYHYDSRRLNFLRSHDLVELVEHLGQFETVDEGLATIQERRRPAFTKALAALASSSFLEPAPTLTERSELEATGEGAPAPTKQAESTHAPPNAAEGRSSTHNSPTLTERSELEATGEGAPAPTTRAESRAL